MRAREWILRFAFSIIIVVIGTLSATISQAAQHKFFKCCSVYVSPIGNDHNFGYSSAEPVLSFGRAMEVVREIRTLYPALRQPVYIKIESGDYRLSEPIFLQKGDAGTDLSPTIFTGTSDKSPPHIFGTVRIGIPTLTTCNEDPRSHAFQICQIPLSEDIFHKFGVLQSEGLGLPSAVNPIGDVFFDKLKLARARWPKSGFAHVTKILGPAEFEFSPSAEIVPKEAISGAIWARGYWGNNWADYLLPVTGISFSDNTLRLNEVPRFGLKSGARFYIEYSPSLIDSAYEWALDSGKNSVYISLPGARLIKGDIDISIALNLIYIDGASNLQFRNLNLRASRGDAVVVKNGRNISFAKISVSDVGGAAFRISGEALHVENATLSGIGLGGVYISSGDRINLRSGLSSVIGSNIYNYAQRVHTYQPGISVDGVGVVVEGNKIHSAPHSGIIFRGNDHLIKGNEIYEVMRETTDGGAIYTGRNWTDRGSKVVGNYIHDIVPFNDEAVMGVYLDDQASGIDVSHNIFWNVDYGAFVGGGSDNFVSSNIFVSASHSIYLDSRGGTWQKDVSRDAGGVFHAFANSVPYESERWIKAYPTLGRQIQELEYLPRRNVFIRNSFINSGSFDLHLLDGAQSLQHFEGNSNNSLPGLGSAPLGKVVACRELAKLPSPFLVCSQK